MQDELFASLLPEDRVELNRLLALIAAPAPASTRLGRASAAEMARGIVLSGDALTAAGTGLPQGRWGPSGGFGPELAEQA
jgi:hypothetical protein